MQLLGNELIQAGVMLWLLLRTRDAISVFGSAGKDLPQSSSWNLVYGRFRLKTQVGSVGYWGEGKEALKQSHEAMSS